MDKYLITIGEAEYEVTPAQIAGLDLVQTGKQQFHLLLDGKAHHCEVLAFDAVNKVLNLQLNGKQFQLQVADRYDQMVKKMGLSVVNSQVNNDILAPMPGLILDIMVQVGDTIEAGSPLLILEAMKMENVLKAEGEGVVKAINVKQGEAVDKKQLLLEME